MENELLLFEIYQGSVQKIKLVQNFVAEGGSHIFNLFYNIWCYFYQVCIERASNSGQIITKTPNISKEMQLARRATYKNKRINKRIKLNQF